MEQVRHATTDDAEPYDGAAGPDDQQIAQAETTPQSTPSQPAAAPQGRVVEVPMPAPNQTIVVDPEPGTTVRLAFDADAATVVADGNDLVLQINGGKVVVQGYFAELAQGDLPTFTDLPGGEIDLGALLAEPAAGGPQAGTPPPVPPTENHFFTPGPAETLLPPLGPAGPLGPTQLGYSTTEPEQSFFPVEDDGGGGEVPADVPVATPDIVDAVSNTINLVIAFDRSGSMDENPNVPGFTTRIDLARAAVASMLAAYESVADINVLIVDFASEANNSGWLASAAAADAYLAGLDANGGTNYNGAVQEIMGNYGIGLPGARQSLVYFLSDGKPEPASSSLQARGTIDDWEGFLADNGIGRAIAVGIGPDVSNDDGDLSDVAFPNGDPGNVIIVSDESDTFDALVATLIGAEAAGNVLTDGPPDRFGTDGPGSPPIVSLAVDGELYEFDGIQITRNGTLVTVGSTLVVVTALGGELTFDFLTGAYAYDVATSTPSGAQEQFVYTIADASGDTDDATLTIRVGDLDVTEPNRVFGTAGNDAGLVGSAAVDVIGSGDGNDAIDAAGGDDHVSAGSGADTVQGGAGDDIIVGGNQGEITDAPGQVRPGGADLGDVIDGGAGDDVIFGNEGNDTVTGGAGADTISGGPGADTIRYDSPLDAGDVVRGFDATPAGGQDVVDLDGLFDSLGVADADRAGRVEFQTSGTNVNLNVDADGNAANGAELTVLAFTNASAASFTAGTAPTDDVQVGTA
jgi:Ca2+-binding RTX toxin-like protein